MKKISLWMSENGITQKQLAQWLKKSQPAISKILDGSTVLSPLDAKIIIAKSKGVLSWEKIYGAVK